MKQVLLIDGSPIFKEFLSKKLTEESIKVEASNGERDAFIKLVSLLPDLVIIDLLNFSGDLMEVLSKKQSNPNAKSIPIILCGPKIDRSNLASLIKYGVIKYFTTPIKFDIFFETIGRVLKESFSFDTTPCVLDLHLNKSIVFIEVAEGLNREKISLLRFKIAELIDANNIANPKIIVMLTNLDLSFVDVTNLELLFDSILANKDLKRENIKILSMNPIVQELLEGHTDYKGLEVVSNLASVLTSLLDSAETADTSQLITDKILSADENIAEGSIEMRFSGDSGTTEIDEKEIGNVIKVAIIDDDAVVRQLIKNALFSVGASSSLFENGSDFLKSLATERYNLVILDIFMQGYSGFDILKFMQKNPNSPPVIVYSQAIQQNVVMQALSLGAKTFMLKPQKPEVIARKVIEILNGKS